MYPPPLDLHAEAEIRTGMDLTSRCVLPREVLIATKTAIDIDRRVSEHVRSAKIVFDDPISLAIRLPEVDARWIADRIGSGGTRIVEHRPVQVETGPQVRKFFD